MGLLSSTDTADSSGSFSSSSELDTSFPAASRFLDEEQEEEEGEEEQEEEEEEEEQEEGHSQ